VLQRVPEHRRATLLAERRSNDGAAVYCFNLVLQGESETVFFNL
jgi:protocatechuate 3,4-dioxygenase beta subunit